MTDTKLTSSYLRTLTRELRWRPLARRRLVVELSAHLDESAAELRAAGMTGDDAAAEAVRRLGDPESVVAACRLAGRHPRWNLRGRRLRSPAWLAVGAMSLVTAWAAELPQASGAKTTTSAIRARPGPGHHGRRPSWSAMPARRQR